MDHENANSRVKNASIGVKSSVAIAHPKWTAGRSDKTRLIAATIAAVPTAVQTKNGQPSLGPGGTGTLAYAANPAATQVIASIARRNVTLSMPSSYNTTAEQ